MAIDKLNCAGRVREVADVRSLGLLCRRRSCQGRRHVVLSLSSTKDSLVLTTVSLFTTLSITAKERGPHSAHGLTLIIACGYVAASRKQDRFKRIPRFVVV